VAAGIVLALCLAPSAQAAIVSGDFTISASPASLTVPQGGSGTVTIVTALSVGSAESISLSASGLPSGTNASFLPASVTSGQSSTMTISASPSAATGTSTVTVTGSASSGANSTPVSLTITPNYTFSGFLAPISNTEVNVGKAGRTYPVQFQLTDSGGNFVSSLSAVTSITFTKIDCGTLVADPTTTMTADATGGTTLRYDSTQNEYVFNWQTPGSDAGTCQRLNLSLDSGQTFYADFQLR
jgi:hypothetical protein